MGLWCWHHTPCFWCRCHPQSCSLLVKHSNLSQNKSTVLVYPLSRPSVFAGSQTQQTLLLQMSAVHPGEDGVAAAPREPGTNWPCFLPLPGKEQAGGGVHGHLLHSSHLDGAFGSEYTVFPAALTVDVCRVGRPLG